MVARHRVTPGQRPVGVANALIGHLGPSGRKVPTHDSVDPASRTTRHLKRPASSLSGPQSALLAFGVTMLGAFAVLPLSGVGDVVDADRNLTLEPPAASPPFLPEDVPVAEAPPSPQPADPQQVTTPAGPDRQQVTSAQVRSWFGTPAPELQRPQENTAPVVTAPAPEPLDTTSTTTPQESRQKGNRAGGRNR